MDIYHILDEDCFQTDLQAESKDEVLFKLAVLASRSEKLSGISADAVYQQLAEREKQGSTGFGDGVAIPHARVKGMSDFLVFIAISPKGVNFDALDKKRVKIIFVILGPAEVINDHLQILAAVSRTVGSPRVRNEMLKAPTKQALYEAFLRHYRGTTGESPAARTMVMMTLILYEDQFIYDILEFFLQQGIEGATIIDSSGMGQYISNVPIFADFIGFMSEKKNSSKTIMALVPEDRVGATIKGIEEITGDLDQKQGALIVTQPVSLYRGSMKIM